MQSWIIYGLLASLFFGINVVILKIAQTRGTGLNPYIAGIASGAGIFLVFLIAYLLNPSSTSNWQGVGIAVIAGMIWAVGSLMVILAIASKGDVSRLTPLYNTNTLVAVVLGIFLLKEVPSMLGSIKILIGGLLVVIGAILVTS